MGQQIFGAPKTFNSTNSIPLPETLVAQVATTKTNNNATITSTKHNYAMTEITEPTTQAKARLEASEIVRKLELQANIDAERAKVRAGSGRGGN